MRTRFALSALTALVLGAGGLLTTPAWAGPGGPADCDSYTFNDVNGTGYATVTCYAPSAYYVGHVVCQVHGSAWPYTTYTVTGTSTPIYVTATIRCHTSDIALTAGGVQA